VGQPGVTERACRIAWHLPGPTIAPGWTLDLMARHSLDFWLTSEDLPDPDNRVTLDAKGDIVLRPTPCTRRSWGRSGRRPCSTS
jgi:hypothetical protein